MPQVAKMLPDIGPEVVGRQLLPARRPRQFAAPVPHAAHRRSRRAASPICRAIAVEDITQEGGEFRLTTAKGEVRAGQGRAGGRQRQHARWRRWSGSRRRWARARPDRRHRAAAAVPASSRRHDLRQTDEGTVMIGDSARKRASIRRGLTLGVSATEAERARAHVPVARPASMSCAPGARIRVMTAGRLPDLRPVGDASRRLRRCAAIPA